MNLSPHFLLSELTVTNTGLLNIPSHVEVQRLTELCTKYLEPWRTRVGPIRVTSGFRTPTVNAAVGGSGTSDHMTGRAADLQPIAWSLEMAWLQLLDLDLPLDQAIFYVRPRGQGWVHIGYREFGRRQYLVQRGSGQPVPWVGWTGPLTEG